MQRRIIAFVADGVTDSGLAIALDVFRTADTVARRLGKPPRFAIEIASADGNPVRTAAGNRLVPGRDARAAARTADGVLVPGMWAEDPVAIDAALERADTRRLIDAAAAAHARGAIVGSSCSGAFVLAAAGLLDDRACTTTWWLAPHLQRRYPRVQVDADRALVAHRSVLTAGAVFAQADLVLHLVGRLAGPSLAQTCARLLLLDVHPSQAPYMALHHFALSDPTVRRAEAWVRKHLADDFEIAALARAVGASARTLARRLDAAVGLTPLQFVQRLRVEVAVHVLETTRLSLQEVATRVGYADPGALRRLIRRETGASPRELRRKV